MMSVLRTLSLITVSFIACSGMAQGERIYIMNAPGYNMADPPLIAAIESLGHTVDVSASGATTLPGGFTSTYFDAVNGYHWLCFFGSQDFTALIPQVQSFIHAGGKVLLQYEVVCCDVASQSAAEMASAFTGLSITPDPAPYIGLAGGEPGWEAVSTTGCMHLTGAAYKCMDGLPPANALNATADLNGGEPSFTSCPNFGFVFQPMDIPGHSGGLVGLGDVNIYYADAGEPPNNGGTDPVDMAAVELIFGSSDGSSSCTLLPMGSLASGVDEPSTDLIGHVFPNPANEQLTVERRTAAPTDLRIYDSVGRLVTSIRMQEAGPITVPTASLAPGAYRLLLRDKDQQQTATFLVEH